MDTERANVSKAAARISRNELRSGGEVGVGGAGSECREGIVLVLDVSDETTCQTHRDDLLSDQPSNKENIVSFPAHTHQEGDWVKGVSEDGLKSEERRVDIEVSTPPGHQSVDQADQCDDAQKRGDDTPGDLNTELSSLGKGVKSVLRLVLLVLWHSD